MPRKSMDILEVLLGLSVHTKNRQRYLDPLLKQNWVELIENSFVEFGNRLSFLLILYQKKLSVHDG